jgi:hypothetical protein
VTHEKRLTDSPSQEGLGVVVTCGVVVVGYGLVVVSVVGTGVVDWSVVLNVVLVDVAGRGVEVVVVGAGVVVVLVTGAVDVEASGVVVPYTGNARACAACLTSKGSA